MESPIPQINFSSTEYMTKYSISLPMGDLVGKLIGFDNRLGSFVWCPEGASSFEMLPSIGEENVDRLLAFDLSVMGARQFLLGECDQKAPCFAKRRGKRQKKALYDKIKEMKSPFFIHTKEQHVFVCHSNIQIDIYLGCQLKNQ